VYQVGTNKGSDCNSWFIYRSPKGFAQNSLMEKGSCTSS